VYATAGAPLTLNLRGPDFLDLPPSLPLPAGWSMIGFTSRSASMTVDTYLSTLSGSWNILHRMGPSGWETARPGGVGFPSMEQGKGYWINLRTAATLFP
ncbi:MAG: hypothetical protein HYX92_20300, partial [Chloroflexi bacterium]|nr:hypothetical protein [Chloroflexota bacterium]